MANVKPPNALGELVDAVCAANGWSRNDVWHRSEQRGGELRKSNLGRLCSGELVSIKAERIYDIADALGVPPSRVAVAAVRAMGFELSSDTVTTSEAIVADPDLSADTKAALLAILRSAEGLRRPRRTSA